MKTISRIAMAGAFGIAMAGIALAQDAKELNFGIISTESQQNLKTQWEPFLADMAKQTGLEVKPFFASDYAGVIEGMRFGKVDVAWYGNKSAIEAVDRANGEVFVQTVAESGEPGYYSLILAPVDSPLNSVEDLLKCDGTLDFGIGDPNSTSGYLVPMTFIFAKNGIDPKECFKTVRNANHETNAMAAANGQVDAATNNTENMAKIEANAPDAFAKIKVIWKSPLIPSDPIVWNKDLDQETKDKLQTFFLTYGTEKSSGDMAAEKGILGGLDWAPFRQSSNAQLLPVRVMEMEKQIGQIQADTSLSAEEKQKQIEELQAQKKAYEDEMAKTTQG
jgi:phosphonate transport system substrate-binding protein